MLPRCSRRLAPTTRAACLVRPAGLILGPSDVGVSPPGVTHLDVIRANTFAAEAMGVDPRSVDVPVIGGHAGETILPLLSQATPPFSFSADEVAALTSRIQNAGTEVVEAKAGAGSATLSMAHAAAEFADSCLRGLLGEPNVRACAYVASSVTSMPFFASRLVLGRSGVEVILPLGPLSPFERACQAKLYTELDESIQKGMCVPNWRHRLLLKFPCSAFGRTGGK